MGRRRLGRETAFKALYRVDLTGKGIEDAVGGLAEDRDTDPEALGFARELLETVGAHRTRLDQVLSGAVEHWTLERMAVVDRSLLRLGTAEILYWPWIPDRVSIDEYVEIAKKFGTEESPGFVNAILDRVAREAREDPGKEARTGAEEAE
jgi:N utilization substance protein B